MDHNGDMHFSDRLNDVLAEVGANAVDFQHFATEEPITPEALKARY